MHAVDKIEGELAIGWAWSGCLAPSATPTWNRVHGGPEVLLRWVESQLGLSAPASPWTGRVAEYAALLAAAGGETYSASLAVDRWATASELLRRRDTIRVAGWDGTAGEGLPPLVNDLARAEKGPRRLQPGLPERLCAVLLALDGGQVLPPHRVVLAEDPSRWSALWRRLLSLLAVSVAGSQRPCAGFDTALGQVQGGLDERQPCRVATDASLRHVVAESRLAACEMVANALSADVTALPDTVVLCEDNGVAVLLDACLDRQGVPTMGGARTTNGLPVLQVLPLALQLCWAPVDPATLLDLVSLPAGPIPRRAGRILAEALAEQPGLGSRRWEEAVAALCAVDVDPEGKLAERITRWLEHDRVTRGSPLPAALVGERCGVVAQWAVAKSQAAGRGAMPAAAREGLLALAAQASALGELAASHGGPLGEAQLARLLDAVRSQGVPSMSRPAGLGGPVLVQSLAQITRPVSSLVWLGLGTGETSAVPWTHAELEALRAAGIDVDDGSRDLSCRRAAEQDGLLRVSDRLLAVGLPGDEEMRWHPLWQQVREGLRGESDGVLDPAALRRVVDGSDAAAIDPWNIRTDQRTVLPPPPVRPLWEVPEGLLSEREQSSASSLEDRLACPLKWTLHYGARLRSSAAAMLPGDFQLRGTFCHAVLAEVFGQEGTCPDAEFAAAEVARIFDQRLPLDAAPLAQPARLIVRDQVRAELLNAASLLVDTLARGGYRVAGTEVAVEGEIDGRRLRGSIDCLAVQPDGSEAVLDFKYGGRSKYPKLLSDGRAVQLATYAAARRHQSGEADVRVAFLLIADGTVHTPEGSPLHGAPPNALVPGAPSIDETWRGFVDALRAADGWLVGEEPIPARPLQDSDDWPAGVDLVLEPRDADPSVCRYCDYGVLCGRKGLE